MSRKGTLAAASAALVGSLVGFGGTIALVVQATQAFGASAAQTSSAVTALCLGIAIAGAIFSRVLRMPVVLAWSTPGAALLAATSRGIDWPSAVGIFLSAAAMMMVVGLVPALGRLAARIPASVASAMLGGVLLPFGLALFRSVESDALLVIALLAVFVAARQRAPLYAMLLVLGTGVAMLLARGDIAALPPGPVFGTLGFVVPDFDMRAIFSVAIPLFLVTLVSQNLPGLVVLRSAGYGAPPRPILLGTGFASLLAAPFGAHAVNLAAITAAICTGEDAHPDRSRRWIAGMFYAAAYLALAAFSPLLVRLFLAMPPAAIAAFTGLALLAPLTSAVETMLARKDERDAAIITFVATASGVTLLGIGAAFWGLVAGFATLAARRLLARR